MGNNRRQMILVAVVVCLFAVGMAGLLNFFKYRTVAERVIQERLAASGQAIETDIQASMALGLSFGSIGTLSNSLARELATDSLIESIDVLDDQGSILYSTDPARAGRPAPARWMEAARKAGGLDWYVRDGADSAATNVIKNNFGLIVGHVAVRYSDQELKASSNSVAGTLAMQALLVFAGAATIASLALLAVMGRLSRHVNSLAATLRSGNLHAGSAHTGPFGPALGRYLEAVRTVETEIALVRGKLMQGDKL